MDSKDRDEIREMQQLIDNLMVKVEKILDELYIDLPKSEEDPISELPIELYDYMKENCSTMFMGIS